MKAIELKFEDKIKIEWDEFLLSCENYHIFQSFQWLKAKANYKFPDKWKPILIQIRDEEKTVFSCGILKWKAPFFPFSFLWAPRGPNFINLNENILKVFHEKIIEIGKREKAIFFVFSPYIKEKEGFLFKETGFSKLELNIPTISMPENVMIISLKENVSEIFDNMEKDTRYMIRRAEREGVKFRESKSLEELKYFHKILKVSGKKKGFPVRNFSHLRNLWDNFSFDERIHLFFSEKGEKIYSGAVILNFGKKCWFLYGASVNQIPKNLFPSHYLQWEIIKWAKAIGIEHYDLRGAMGFNHPPTSPSYGVYHFKKGFGAELVSLSDNLGIVFMPKMFNILFALFKKHIPFIKKLYLKIK